MSSYVHIDNKRKDISILGERPTQRLDDTILAAEAVYYINFTQPNKWFVLSLHYNGSNSFLFANATKIYQFKATTSEIKNYALCLVNVSKDFKINNMKKAGSKGLVKSSSIDFYPIDNNDISDTHNIWWNEHEIK